MQFWDAYKLCHVSRLPGFEQAFLVAIATEGEWARETAGSELFRPEGATSTTYLLRERYKNHWQKLLDKSSKSRPLTLPSALGTARLANVPLATKYGPSRLLVAAIRPVGEWLAVDPDGWPVEPEPVVFDWPYPDGGRGMEAPTREGAFVWPSATPPQIADGTVKPDDIPPSDADWSRVMWFAASMDGYVEFSPLENLAPLANTASAYWAKTKKIAPMDLRALRGCLFFEYRRHHHFGHAPDTETTRYVCALIERIRQLVTQMVTPP